MMSTGRKSIAFMSSTHTNTVSASGATKLRSPWKMPLTWSSTKLDRELDERLALARHAGGRAAHDEPQEAERDDAEHHRGHQRVEVQRPERRIAERDRPELRGGEPMYEVGVSSCAMLESVPVTAFCYLSRTKIAMLKKITVRMNAPKNGAGTSCL